jgi:3-oxoacyl-(acyl-carrier-protein) synthase
MIYLRDFRTACTIDTQLLEDIRFPQRVNWFLETYNKAKMGIVYPPHKLADMVLDSKLITHLRENPVGKTAFIFAAGNSHLAGLLQPKRPETKLTYEYRFLPMTLTQVYAGKIAQSLGAVDHIVTDATACASSLKALMDVQTLINFYDFKRVIVLSFEDAVSNLVLEFFGETQAALSWKEEQTGIFPSAFDKTNYGFHVGQGAVLAVFEDKPYHAPKACLLGAYTASETCGNAIGQSEDGEGFVKAIEGALSHAKLAPKHIKVVKTHGTGTKSNNVSEKAALYRALGMDGYVATSYKQRIGHTMGASGLLETCLLMNHISAGIVPKILNRTEDDDVFLSHDVNISSSTNILSLAAGMGNVYSAAVLGSI